MKLRARTIAPTPGAGTASVWVAPSCALCGTDAADPLRPVAHPDAPDGRAAIVACRACGLGRLAPRPPADRLGAYYVNEYNAFVGRRRGRAKQALWTLARDVAARRRGAARALSALGPLARWAFDVTVPLDVVPPPDVLEVGCGYGDLLLYLRSRGCRVTGVDLDARAAARAREQGLMVHVGELPDVELPAASFDAAVLCHSLEHMTDPAAVLAELARLVRPGGTLHVAVPNGRAAAFAIEGERWEHASVPLHLWFFDETTLVAILAAAGFEVLRTPVATSSYRPLARWLREVAHPGPAYATRVLLRWMTARLRGEGGGDVLRVVARRRADQAPASQTTDAEGPRRN